MPKDLQSSTKYRPDIDGLRAVAIIPVVAFHIWPDAIPNGYLGVDIFFVISGFLIYSILLRDFQQNEFSFRKFWTRRLKRLYPAISVMAVAFLAMGYLILQREEWKSLSEQTIAAFTCSSNIYMWQNANNYWGESSASMPLLHTWSLAVEEQFYILFPIGLFCFFRWNQSKNRLRTLFRAHLIFLAVSFLFWCYAIHHHRSASFYLLPFRAWEILTGCCLAIFSQIQHLSPKHGQVNRWLPDVGLIMISMALLWPSHSHGQSIILSTLCCCGTVMNLCRQTDRPPTILAKLLYFRPTVAIGRMSYSIYLWHWPLIVFAAKVDDYFSGSIFIASLVLGAISYITVERWTRKLTNQSFAHVFAGMSLALAICLTLPFWVHRPSYTYHIPQLMRHIGLTPDNTAISDQYTGDYRSGLLLADAKQLDRLDVLILGDSHAIMFFPAVQQACNNLDIRLAFYGAGAATSPFYVAEGGDPSDYSVSSWTDKQRLEFDNYRRTFIEQYRPKLVIVCAKWSAYGPAQRLSELPPHVHELIESAPSSQFLFVLQPPELPIGSEIFTSGTLELPSLRRFSELGWVKRMRQSAHQTLHMLARTEDRLNLLETEDVYTLGNTIQFRDGDTMLYWDDDHLSVNGAMLSVPRFQSRMEAILADHHLAKASLSKP